MTISAPTNYCDVTVTSYLWFELRASKARVHPKAARTNKKERRATPSKSNYCIIYIYINETNERTDASKQIDSPLESKQAGRRRGDRAPDVAKPAERSIRRRHLTRRQCRASCTGSARSPVTRLIPVDTVHVFRSQAVRRLIAYPFGKHEHYVCSRYRLSIKLNYFQYKKLLRRR
jgi:hypothetical protein